MIPTRPDGLRSQTGWTAAVTSKRQRTAAEQRRDARDAAIRRVLSLVELYAEMAESWLVAETYDADVLLNRIFHCEIERTEYGL